MTKGCVVGECPLGLEACPGLKESSGDEAAALLGPYMVLAAQYGLVPSTAISCPNPTASSQCETTVQEILDSNAQ